MGRSGRGLVVAGLVVLSGCGDGEAVSPPYASGTRLRANLLDGGDGAVLFVDWHDQLLDLDCTFDLAADGVRRCLPSGGFVYYGDPSCSTRVAFMEGEDTCAPPAYAREWSWSDDSCAPASLEVYEVGEPLGHGFMYGDDGSGCVQVPDLFPQRFALGERLDPATLVAEQDVVTEARGDRLRAQMRTAVDGSRQIVALADASDGPCTRTALTDDVDACLGELARGAQFRSFYTDPTCATSVGATAFATCDGRPPSAILAENAIGTCGYETSIHLAGPALDGPVYTGEPGDCFIDSDRTGYQLGRLATAADFPVLTTARLGEGRLRAEYTADGAGRALVPERLVDTVTGQACLVAIAGGSLRCLPGDVLLATDYSPLYADPACSVPAMTYGDGPCDPVMPALIATGVARCDTVAVTAVHTLVAHTGAVYESDSTGVCLETTVPAGHRAFVAGPDVPFDRFPAVSRRTD